MWRNRAFCSLFVLFRTGLLSGVEKAWYPKVPAFKESGGEGGIRTLDRVVRPYNGLANRRLQPLGHLSGLGFAISLACPPGSAVFMVVSPELLKPSATESLTRGD